MASIHGYEPHKERNITSMESKLVRQLVDDFNSSGILYCHWKSNQHLDASMSGDTDLDVLFAPDQENSVLKILAQNGFRLFRAPGFLRYNRIHDYIGIDSENRKIIHVHAHFELATGKTGIKNYQLGVEDVLLQGRVFDEQFQIYRSAPEMECVLLYLRLGLKFKSNQWDLSKPNADFKNILVEREWLSNQINADKLKPLRGTFVKDALFDQIEGLIRADLNNSSLRALSSAVDKEYGSGLVFKLKGSFLRLIRPLRFQIARIARYSSLKYVARKRVNPDKGLIFAIVGSDGSGKSTQISILTKLFKKKVDVVNFYMGSNKGSMSRHRKVISAIYRKAEALKSPALRPFQKIASLALAFSMAWEKRSKIKQANYLRDKGVIVICDRFPQTESPGRNDGPKLPRTYDKTKNPLFGFLMKQEVKLYSCGANRCPDIIFKILVDPEILSSRRNMSINDVQLKQEGVRNLKFGASKVVEIDGNQPIELVSSEILKEIVTSYFSPGK